MASVGSASTSSRAAELERTLESVTVLLAETRRMVDRSSAGDAVPGGCSGSGSGSLTNALPSPTRHRGAAENDAPQNDHANGNNDDAEKRAKMEELKRRFEELEGAVRSLRSEQSVYDDALRTIKEELSAVVAEQEKRSSSLERENMKMKKENVRLAATLKREKTRTQQEVFRAIQREREDANTRIAAAEKDMEKRSSQALEKQRRMTMKLEEKFDSASKDNSSLRQSLRTMKGIAGLLAGVGVSLTAAMVSSSSTS